MPRFLDERQATPMSRTASTPRRRVAAVLETLLCALLLSVALPAHAADPPGNLQVSFNTDNKLIVTWTNPTGFDPDDPGTNILMRWREKDSSNWLPSAQGTSLTRAQISNRSAPVPPSDCGAGCEALDSTKHYEVQLQAVIPADGTSAWSSTGTNAPDPDPPTTLTLSVVNASVSESVGRITVTATLDQPVVSGIVAVTPTAASGSTATATDDYRLSGTYNISQGNRTTSWSLYIVDDMVVENDETIILTATARGLQVTGTTVTIVDDDRLTLNAPADQVYTRGRAITDLALPAATGGTGSKTYTLTGPSEAAVGTALPGLSFTASSRTLSGAPTAAKSAVTLTYTVSDANSVTASATFTVTVVDPPTLGAVNNKTYTVGQTVSDALPAASGGASPLAYTLAPASGALGDALPGLSFTAGSRTLGGAPTTMKSAVTLTYTVTDKNGGTASATFTVTVSTGLALNAPADQVYTRGRAITDLALPAATGGTGSKTYTLTGPSEAAVGTALPGLSFTASSRTLSGAPTAAKSAVTLTYTVSDANSVTASATFTVTVVDPPTLGAVNNKTYTVGQTVSDALPAASGGASPLAYTLAPASGALGDALPGLSFTAGSRTLGGAPTTMKSAVTLTYTVTDKNGGTASATFTVTVNPGVSSIERSGDATLSALALADSNDNPVTFSPSFTPGVLTYTATLSASYTGVKVTPTANHSGAGITVNGAAVASGTASGLITLNYGANEIPVVVTAEDDATRTYTITVNRALPVVSFAASTYRAQEGASFQVRLRRDWNDTGFTSGMAYKGNTADIASDLGASRPATYPFPANGDLIVTLEIPTVDDTTDENDEDFTLTIRPGTGYTVGAPSVATLTIIDNDDTPNPPVQPPVPPVQPPVPPVEPPVPPVEPPPSGPGALSLRAFGIAEEGGAPVSVMATLDAPAPAGGTTVTLTTTGTATRDTGNDGDYRLSPTTFTIGAGETRGTATLTVIDDNEYDAGETVVLNATSVNPALTAQPLTLTILDNDTPPSSLTLHVDRATIPESAGKLPVSAALDAVAGANGVTVTLTAGPAGTATNGEDYTLPPTFTIAPGGTHATALLSVHDDTLVEADETLVLGAVMTPADLRVNGVTLTITDDDELSSDATLRALSLTDNDNAAVALTPAFASGTARYTAEVANHIAGATLTPTANHPAATITVAGAPVPSGQTSATLDLAVGENPLAVVVTAQDRTTTQTYTVTVTRATAPLSLAAPADRDYPINTAIDPLTLPSATGGMIPYRYALTPLPPGLRFDPHTRVLSGTPTAVGATTLTYSVTDADGATASATFTLTLVTLFLEANRVLLPEVARALADSTLGAIAGRIESACPGEDGARAGTDAAGGAGLMGRHAPTRAACVTRARPANPVSSGAAGLPGTGAGFNSLASMANGAGTHAGPATASARPAWVPDSRVDSGWTHAGPEVNLKTLLDGAGFLLPLSTESDPDGGPPATGLASATLWGSGNYRDLGGEDGGLSWDGGLWSAQLGADVRLRADLLAGLALAWQRVDLDYRDASGPGKQDLTLTGVHPYLGWTTDRLALWATAGYGWGELDMDHDGQTQDGRSDVTLRSAGAGVSGVLWAGAATTLSLKGEGLLAELEVDGSATMAALSADVNRLRLAIAASRRHELAEGAVLTPGLELGLRHDGGDGDTGAGAELGGDLDYRAGRFTVRGRARALVGRDGHDEWGVQGLVQLQPGRDGRGLAFVLRPGYGAADSGLQRLWAEGLRTATHANEASPRDYRPRLEVSLGYGWEVAGGLGLLTPYTEMRFNGTDHYRLGARWTLGRWFNLNLVSERLERTGAGAEHAILLESEFRFW